MSKYINHITLSTGHIARTSSSDVADDVIEMLKPWIDQCINQEDHQPFPLSELSHFAATAYIQDGALVMTVYAPDSPHEPGKPAKSTELPLVTFAVAERSRHQQIWYTMLANFDHADNIKMPSEPWIAVAVHPSSITYLDSLDWLGDFERCVAWTWIDK